MTQARIDSDPAALAASLRVRSSLEWDASSEHDPLLRLSRSPLFECFENGDAAMVQREGKIMEEAPAVDNPTKTETNEEEFFLFVGAATEVPEIRWPKVMLEEGGISDE